MTKRLWTDPQRDAITAKGGSVLVSAAAGSGKTAVLVERAVGLICDPANPVDANRLLIVTFSRAAAAEMRQRMRERIAELIQQTPGDLYLQRQQALLVSAQICTVDSFCLDLVRQNFQNLEIAPDFSIIDQNELTVLQQDCADDLIAWYYENDQSGEFLPLVELLAAGRDDQRLAETILKIYEFSLSHPFFDEWMGEMERTYAADCAVEKTLWGESILRYAGESLAYCAQTARASLETVCGDEKMQKAYGPALSSDMQRLRHCMDLLENGSWDDLVAALRGFVFERLGSLRGEEDQKEQIKSARERVKETVKELSSKYLNATSIQFQEDLRDLRPKIQLLFQMVRDFDKRLWSAKTAKKRLQFSDLEHLALRLLVERTEDGFRPTQEALQIAEQYDYVLVDEYQDTNAVQDMIFTCISRAQRNLFMVGDVKQSIYSFRQAMPEIFMKKKAVFFPYDTGLYPAKIMLDTNFRSRREVTDAVNAVFGQIMSEACGDVDYDAQESLKCGARYLDYAPAKPELILVDIQDCDSADAADREAQEIARKIKSMLADGYLVEERGARRPAALRDFCILMRSPKSRAAVYVKALARCGITATAENTGGYLSAREVAAVVSLLKALDNPLLDIELVAALLSPLFDFSDDDVARIRLAARGKPFFTALHRAKETGERKAEAFLAMFARLRAQAAVLSADRLIMRVYEETEALAVFGAMEMGEHRRANLLLLMEYAADYHALGYQRLGGFVGFLGRLEAKEGDLAPASGIGDGAQAVRIMSVHRSKGLEFPIVFVADMAKAFNKTDLRQTTLLHSRYGFACVRREERTFRQYPTIPLQAIQLELRFSMLSEEMRILYVALTRAREKLILTGTIKKELSKRLAELSCEPADGKLPAYHVGECGCYLDWILMALQNHPCGRGLRALGEDAASEQVAGGDGWSIALVKATHEAETPADRKEEAPAAPVDEALLRVLAQRAQWRYPQEQETKIPAKLAISAVSKGEIDAAARFQARPKFLTNQKLTPAEQGNAMHKFMQFADYEAAQTRLEQEIERMEQEGFLSPLECKSLQSEKLRQFFASALAERIFRSGDVRRELRFMAECGAEVLGNMVAGIGESRIVLQGVADCVFVEEGRAVIVDYKTDRVKSPEELAGRYARQLQLYRAILEDSLEIPVCECVLYSFYLGEAVKIN